MCDCCVTGGTERNRHYPDATIQQPTTTANNNNGDGLNCCLDHALLPGVVKQTTCVNDWSSLRQQACVTASRAHPVCQLQERVHSAREGALLRVESADCCPVVVFVRRPHADLLAHSSTHTYLHACGERCPPQAPLTSPSSLSAYSLPVVWLMSTFFSMSTVTSSPVQAGSSRTACTPISRGRQCSISTDDSATAAARATQTMAQLPASTLQRGSGIEPNSTSGRVQGKLP